MKTHLRCSVSNTPPIFICFLTILLIFSNGCAPAKFAPPQSEIDKFKDTHGLINSEIPKAYDESHLRVGSRVTLKGLREALTIQTPFLIQKTVKSIDSNDVARKYIVEIANVDGRGKYTETVQLDPFSISALMISDNGTIIDANFNHNDNYISIDWAKIAQGLFFGVIGAAMAGAHQYQGSYDIPDEEVAQIMMKSNESVLIKVIDFNFVTREEISIENRTFSCRVYQTKVIINAIGNTMDKHKVERPMVINRSEKIWISDEVPFGIVKSENDSTVHYGENKAPININTKLSAVEFQY